MHRPRHELGDAPAAGRPRRAAGAGSSPSRTRSSGSVSSGCEQPGHEVRRRSCGCRRRASRRCRRRTRTATSTARCPCPIPAGSSGRTSSTASTRAPSQRGGLGGGVGRAVVHHHDLVDERRRARRGCGAPSATIVADGGLLVAGREAHRDRVPGRCLAATSSATSELGDRHRRAQGTQGPQLAAGEPAGGPCYRFAEHALIQSG